MSVFILSGALFLLLAPYDTGIMPYLIMAVGLVIYPMTQYDCYCNNFKKILSAFLGIAIIAFSVFIFSLYDKKLVLIAEVFALSGALLIFLSLKNGLAYNLDIKLGTKEEMWPVILLTLAAFAVRIVFYDKIPLGYWFDEAQNGNEVMYMLKNNSFEIFIPRYTQMPAMFIWLASPFVKIFGADIFSLRFVNIFLGSLCVPAFYFLLRYILKNSFWAFFGAFLLCFSRWHIIFSRVAFLGMQTIFVQIVFFYFYFRMIKEGRIMWAFMSGFTAGILMYTFSAANFVLIAAVLHALFLMIKSGTAFFRRNYKNIFIAVSVFSAVSLPIILYAVKNYDDYTRRMKDVSVTNDIQKEKSISPLLRNIKLHLLMFHYEGDYNGRHNLYKKPVIEQISGFLLLAGLAAVAAGIFSYAPYAGSFALIWFFVMLLPGILTNTVEAPQAYRTSGVIPAMIMLCTAGAMGISRILEMAGRKKKHIIVLAVFIALFSSVSSLREYFWVYPKEKSAFMDFSPEASGIARTINSESSDWVFYVSKADNMYGFYKMEQMLMLSFLSAPKNRFYYIEKEMMIDKGIYTDKKGIAFITRPTDKELRSDIMRLFPGIDFKKHENPHTGDELFGVHYVDSERLSGTNKFVFKGVK